MSENNNKIKGSLKEYIVPAIVITSNVIPILPLLVIALLSGCKRVDVLWSALNNASEWPIISMLFSITKLPTSYYWIFMVIVITTAINTTLLVKTKLKKKWVYIIIFAFWTLVVERFHFAYMRTSCDSINGLENVSSPF